VGHPRHAGLEHRIGGIEKADGAGTISYDPDNHDKMVRLRQAKIDGIAADIPPLEVDDPSGEARVLVLGWGSTYGSIGARSAASGGGRLGRPGAPAAPEPVPGQPRRRAARLRQGARPRDQPRPARAAAARPYLVDVISYNRVRGLPFRAAELAESIEDVIAHV
jgi:2-oxoglutarate ferredoxin oxidoreductase subunit alpha